MHFSNSFVLFVTLAATLASAAPASYTIKRSDGDLHCKERYAGQLALTTRSDLSAAGQRVTLSQNKYDTLTTDLNAGKPADVNDVQFTFFQCTTAAHGWNTATAVVGQIHVHAPSRKFYSPWNDGCVSSAIEEGGAKGAHLLNVESCVQTANSKRLERQWFIANDLREQGNKNGHVTLELRGGPQGQRAYANVLQTKAGIAARTQHTDKTLALINVQDK